MKVSIPYRLATNLERLREKNQKKRFQFLIGWLQTTQQNRFYKYNLLMFQFLIGWLQTKTTLQHNRAELPGFNSL